jgi:hypothetical protein
LPKLGGRHGRQISAGKRIGCASHVYRIDKSRCSEMMATTKSITARTQMIGRFLSFRASIRPILFGLKDLIRKL